MRLGREVYEIVRCVAGEDVRHRRMVGDVRPFQCRPLSLKQIVNGGGVAGVGQFVRDDDAIVGLGRCQADKISADKARPAGEKTNKRIAPSAKR